MSKWPMVPLGDVLVQDKDYIDAPEPKVYPKLSVKLYGRGVVQDAPTDGSDLRMKRHQLAKAGQVILSEIWGKKGAIGLVPDEGDGALCTSHFFLFDIVQERLSRRWIEYIFRGNYLEPQLNADARGTTGYAAVRPKNLLAAMIPLPPLSEQQRIVEWIDAVATRVEEAQRLRHSLAAESTALMKSIMRTLISSEPIGLHRIADVCSEVIDCLHSNPVYSEGGIPTLRSPDVGWGQLFFDTARTTDEAEYERRTSRGEPTEGDIIVVREGGGTGKAGIVRRGDKFSLGQRVMMLRPDRTQVEPKYLLYHWLSPLIQEDEIASRMTGSASPHLNIGAIKQFPLRLPAVHRQRELVAYLDEIQAQGEELQRNQSLAVVELEAIVPSVLNHAFNGRE